jgi:hypothetical protein
MEIRRALTPAIAALALTLGLWATGYAQTAAPTPAPMPTNPNWCPGVPESPAPPRYPPSDWAALYKGCSSLSLPRHSWIACRRVCMGARADWATSHNPPAASPFPLSTNVPQGPIPLPGGGEGYVLPLLPPPGTPGAAPTPSAPQGSSDPPGLVPGGGIRWC